MKKFFAILVAALLAVSAAALADTTYVDPDRDFTFDYDEEFFEITMDDHSEDEDLVILTDKNDGYIRIHKQDLEDGEKFPTPADIKESWGVEAETMEEWGNFKNTLYFELTDESGATDYVFISPVYDDDGEIDDILTVNIGSPVIEDEEAAMLSSDKISAVVDSLRVIDD